MTIAVFVKKENLRSVAGEKSQCLRVFAPLALDELSMNAENNIPATTEEVLLLQCYQQLYYAAISQYETDRTQLVTYLNDTAVQSLSAMHMQLSLLMGNAEAPTQLQADLQEALAQIIDLMDGMTGMARSLRPLELDTLGLNAALEQASEEFSRLSQISVQYEVEGTDNLGLLPETAVLAFYRLAQEAFLNIIKHAQATQVHVSLQGDDRSITLTIADNGRGFAPAAENISLLDAPGLGLFGLMVRFQQLNGRVTLNTAVAKGTTVTAVLPITTDPKGF
jgi:two-component system NarL family sensor kinase